MLDEREAGRTASEDSASAHAASDAGPPARDAGRAASDPGQASGGAGQAGPRDPVLTVSKLSKTYAGGHKALDGVDLAIERGEILALLGPNGAGKTTLISCICGIAVPSEGTITVDGHDAARDYRAARSLIGLVPQEITLEPFEPVINTVRFSRGLFGKGRNDALIEDILKRLSLWDKRDARIRELSGGMKRRVLIAKALAHEPRILFLDEPTAGVDVELRRDMWAVVEGLRDSGVTTILTTHYIEEAEAIADRVAVILGGRIVLVEDKDELMGRMGRRELRVDLAEPVGALPDSLSGFDLERAPDGVSLTYRYDARGPRTGITALLNALSAEGLRMRDLETRQSSLEDIFVELVHAGDGQAGDGQAGDGRAGDGQAEGGSPGNAAEDAR